MHRHKRALRLQTCKPSSPPTLTIITIITKKTMTTSLSFIDDIVDGVVEAGEFFINTGVFFEDNFVDAFNAVKGWGATAVQWVSDNTPETVKDWVRTVSADIVSVGKKVSKAVLAGAKSVYDYIEDTVDMANATPTAIMCNETRAEVGVFLVQSSDDTTPVIRVAPNPLASYASDDMVASDEAASILAEPKTPGQPAFLTTLPAEVWHKFLHAPESVLVLNIGPHVGPDGTAFPGGVYGMLSEDLTHPVLVMPNVIRTILQPLQGGLGFTYQLDIVVFNKQGSNLDKSWVGLVLRVRENRTAVIHLTAPLAKTNQGVLPVSITFANTKAGSQVTVPISTAPGPDFSTAWACLPEGTNEVTYKSSCVAPDRCNGVMTGSPIAQQSVPVQGDGTSIFMLTRIIGVTTPDSPTAAQCAGLTQCAAVACVGSSAVATILFSNTGPVSLALGAALPEPATMFPSSSPSSSSVTVATLCLVSIGVAVLLVILVLVVLHVVRKAAVK